jgi:hypothetical protein
VSYRPTWRAVEEADDGEHFLLFRFGSCVGEITLDPAALGGPDVARRRVQDVVVILNAPEIIEAWLAVRDRERGRVR